MKQKKAQIQLGEGIAVVIIIIVLLVIGIAFWTNINREEIQEMNTDIEELGVVELAKIVSELPELRCYTSNTVTKVNCFDYYKLLAMQSKMRDTKYANYYYNYFKSSKIIFQEVYPGNMTLIVYDTNTSSRTSPRIYIPIIIENRTGREGIKNFGMLIVEAYYK
jgi:hypothetical protein